MTITFYFFEYELVYIIIIILWIFQGCSFVLGSRILKTDSDELQFLRFLIIAGYILTLWAVASFFFPTTIRVSLPTESEEIIFFIIPLLLSEIIPSLVFIILGLALLIFFKRNSHIYQKLLAKISIFFIGGYVLKLINSVLVLYFINFGISIYTDLADLFLALDIISLSILIITVLIIILFSIYLNNRFFMIFSSLYLVQLFHVLIPMLPYV